MNGIIKTKFAVIDTNQAILATKAGFDSPLLLDFPPDTAFFVSIVTEMELLAKPDLSTDEEMTIRSFLADTDIIPLTEEVKLKAIAIRRFGKPRPKLPDAIVAATASLLGATLVTADKDLAKLDWPELRIMYAA
jgi:predicted nucleic acid-binding protein